MKWFAAGLVLAVSVLAGAQVIPDLGFTSRLSPALAAEYSRKFGEPVPDRFTRWASIARDYKAASFLKKLDAAKGREADILQVVNDAINTQMKWIDDKTHWGVDDYWATPAESSGSGAGDCEDFSIAKYYLLKELGVPIERLRITYVRAMKQGGQAHVVLTYYSRPDAEPLVLDNIDTRVRPASQRSDLEPVYSFNDDEVQVQGKARGKPSQIRAWLAVQGRLLAETKF